MKGKKRRWISLWAAGLLLAFLAAPAYGAEAEPPESWTEFSCGTPAEAQEELQAALLQRKINELREEAGIAPSQLWIGDPHLMPSTGQVRLLVLPIMFADSKPLTGSWEQDLEYYQQLFNGEDDGGELMDQSVHSYFLRQSYGRLNVTADVLPIYFVDGLKEAYVTEKDAHNYHPKYNDLVGEALRTYRIDYSQYDADGDGSVDCLCTIEGDGFIGDRYGTLTADYAGWADYVYNEESMQFQKISTLTNLGGKGGATTRVAAHELMHAMGLAD